MMFAVAPLTTSAVELYGSTHNREVLAWELVRLLPSPFYRVVYKRQGKGGEAPHPKASRLSDAASCRPISFPPR